MEIKKNPQVNLDKSRTLYLQMGLMLALGMVFISFEYVQKEINMDEIQCAEEVVIEEEVMPITRAEKILPPPPPPPPAFSEVLTIVDDDIELDEELELDDMELDEEANVEIIAFEEDDEEDDNVIFQRVEKMPQFPGGYEALMKYLQENLKYPKIAEENGIQGRVFVKFIVMKDGGIGDVRVLKGVDSSIDAEAVRVVKAMPHWHAGEQRSRPVNVSCNIPIAFTLQ